MIIHTSPLFTAYFGAASDGISAQEYRDALVGHTLTADPFIKLQKAMHVESALFLHQVHGASGVVITSKTQPLVSFAQDGDFLITTTKQAIGVLTADCLPIVMFDALHNAVAVVHAGWRGSVQSIVVRAIEAMQQSFGTKPEHLKILFGPSAKVCCYKVSDDFVQQLDEFSRAGRALIKHGGDYYFDLPGFNKLQLEELGIKKDALCLQYSICTICHTTFNSYRRQGAQSGRQITAVCLR